jgi:hypothetical protein
MGEVISMFGYEEDPPFGVQAQTDLGVPGISQQPAAPEAGAQPRQGPPKSVLKASLERGMAYARQATARLTQLLPAGVAEAKLKALLDSYATIQENAGILAKRLAAPDIDLVKDIREFEKQVQAYVEASELLLREHVSGRQLQGLGQTTTAANGAASKTWLLWTAAVVGVGVVALGVWYLSKNTGGKRRSPLPARGPRDFGGAHARTREMPRRAGRSSR